MSKSWNHDRAAKHIDQKIADVEEITIKDYVRDMSLESILPVPRTAWMGSTCMRTS